MRVRRGEHKVYSGFGKDGMAHLYRTYLQDSVRERKNICLLRACRYLLNVLGEPSMKYICGGIIQ